MEKNLISVILPVWKPDINQLKQCIDSLIKQTYSEIEIIISYRESLKYDKEFYRLVNGYNDNRIKIIIENQGFQKQLNKGIINSRGNFIARIDGDDFCELDRFEKQLAFLKANNCDIVGSWANYITNEGNKIKKIKVPITHNEIRKKIMLFDPILHPTVLMSREMIQNLNYYDEQFLFAEDYELWLRAISKGYKFGNIPECLVNIRHNPKSITRGKTWKKSNKYTLKAKNKAILYYDLNKPNDIFNYLVGMMFLLISPKMTIKINRILGRYNIESN